LRQKPLPNRHHVVISRSALSLPDGVDLVHSIEDAIFLCKRLNLTHNDHKQICIIGGAQIYVQSLSLVDELELTWVDTNMEGDAFFPEIPKDLFIEVERRATVSETAPFYKLSFVSYQKINK
jgi:dihydrofolate reductase